MINVFITILLSIIGLLVSVIGYFLIKDQRRQEVFNTRVMEVIEKLECIANELCVKSGVHDTELKNIASNHKHLQERFEKFKDSQTVKA